MSLIVERRRPLLDLRSVVIAVVVLMLGAALGFGVGYEVKAHRTTSTSKTTAATRAKGVHAPTAAQTAANARFRTCLNSHGVKYPPISGGQKAFAAQISKPPAGVSQSTYEAALRACYAAAYKKP
jgi:hypothetical protein